MAGGRELSPEPTIRALNQREGARMYWPRRWSRCLARALELDDDVKALKASIVKICNRVDADEQDSPEAMS